MLLLKPKDIAQSLNTPPDKVTKYAQDIEEARLHTFHKTPLGSYLFEENEIELLKDYQEMMYFFQRKKEALAMLQEERTELTTDKTTDDLAWTRFLYNVKNLP